MANVIAVANHKGGVGKTTTAVNLAACLAEAGRRVLLADLDPQGQASEHLGLKLPDHEHTPVARVLMGMGPANATVTSKVFGFDFMPGGKGTAVANSMLERHTEYLSAFDTALNNESATWDVVLLDTPPQPGVLVQAALRASQYVLVPLELDPLPLAGMLDLFKTIDAEREHNPELKLAGWFVTNSDPRAVLSRDVLMRARAARPDHELETVIRRNKPLAAASGWGRPITVHDAKCSGTEDYRALAAELIKRGIA